MRRARALVALQVDQQFLVVDRLGGPVLQLAAEVGHGLFVDKPPLFGRQADIAQPGEHVTGDLPPIVGRRAVVAAHEPPQTRQEQVVAPGGAALLGPGQRFHGLQCYRHPLRDQCIGVDRSADRQCNHAIPDLDSPGQRVLRPEHLAGHARIGNRGGQLFALLTLAAQFAQDFRSGAAAALGVAQLVQQPLGGQGPVARAGHAGQSLKFGQERLGQRKAERLVAMLGDFVPQRLRRRMLDRRAGFSRRGRHRRRLGGRRNRRRDLRNGARRRAGRTSCSGAEQRPGVLARAIVAGRGTGLARDRSLGPPAGRRHPYAPSWLRKCFRRARRSRPARCWPRRRGSVRWPGPVRLPAGQRSRWRPTSGGAASATAACARRCVERAHPGARRSIRCGPAVASPGEPEHRPQTDKPERPNKAKSGSCDSIS